MIDNFEIEIPLLEAEAMISKLSAHMPWEDNYKFLIGEITREITKVKGLLHRSTLQLTYDQRQAYEARISAIENVLGEK